MKTLKLLGCLCLLSLLIVGASAQPGGACTDFRLKAKDGSVVIGRSMEFSIPLQSQVVVFRRGQSMDGQAPKEKPGLKWTSKYGFVGINGLGIDLICDGMNEKGLSLEFLWLPGTKYQDVPSDGDSRAVLINNLGMWILGNFATVAEVRQALPKVVVWGQVVPQLGIVPPLHLAIHDAAGNSVVVEFLGGKVVYYDNPVGVMTNSPTYDWHMTNLRNYVGLGAFNDSPQSIAGLTLRPTGSGSHQRGIPGDSTPPSRFIRAAFYANTAAQAKDAAGAVVQAQHVLNVVDIPLGAVREKMNGKLLMESTQWVVIKDLAGLVMYYRTYGDQTLRAVHLKKLDFSAGAKPTRLPMEGPATIIDVTKRLQK